MSAPLPVGLKRVSVATLVLTGLVGFGAAQSLAMLLEPPTLDPAALAALDNSAPFKEAMMAMFDAQLAAYEAMRVSRSLILFGLSVAATLSLVASVQLIWAPGIPRELLRRRLATTMLVAAVLRTLEGAQSSAVNGRAGAAIDRVMSKGTEVVGGWPAGLAETGYVAVTMALSFVMCGSLLAMALYFRSERVRKAIGALDTTDAA